MLKMKNLEKNSKHTLVEEKSRFSINRETAKDEKSSGDSCETLYIHEEKWRHFISHSRRYENLSAATVIHHYNNTFTNAQRKSPGVTHNLQCRENI